MTEPVKVHKVPSTMGIVLYSFVTAFFVLIVGVCLQWIVYDDWLHRSGPVRLVGTTMAAVLTFGFVFHWQHSLQQRHREMLQRFKTIAEMNDRVRNALQAIQCVDYLQDQKATNEVREAVALIDEALRGVVTDPTIAVTTQARKMVASAAVGHPRLADSKRSKH